VCSLIFLEINMEDVTHKIKSDTNYRTSLINRLKIVRASLELAYATPDKYTNKIDATIEYLEELNDLVYP
jgi:hypothetical protein